MTKEILHLEHCLEYFAITVALSINPDLSSACICYNCRCCSVTPKLQIIYDGRRGTKVSSRVSTNEALCRRRRWPAWPGRACSRNKRILCFLKSD